jgi:hypothetical protein
MKSIPRNVTLPHNFSRHFGAVFPGLVDLPAKANAIVLTQFFSHDSLRELQERRHFCHNTFRDSGKNGLLLQPRL